MDVTGHRNPHWLRHGHLGFDTAPVSINSGKTPQKSGVHFVSIPDTWNGKGKNFQRMLDGCTLLQSSSILGGLYPHPGVQGHSMLGLTAILRQTTVTLREEVFQQQCRCGYWNNTTFLDFTGANIDTLTTATLQAFYFKVKLMSPAEVLSEMISSAQALLALLTRPLHHIN